MFQNLGCCTVTLKLSQGKAAIDVVGSQAGKSSGSILQQVLLLVCGGAIAGSLPIMLGVFIVMTQVSRRPGVSGGVRGGGCLLL